MSDAENNTPAAEEEKTDMNDHTEDTSPEKEEKDDDKIEVKEEEEAMEEVVEEKVQTPKKAESSKKSPQKTPKEQSEEEMEEDDDDDESDTPKLGLLEQPVVIESGKRAKRKVERLDMSSSSTPKEKKKLIPDGSGEKLGDSPIIEYMLQKTKADDLKLLHKILFNRQPENAVSTRRNIRQFCGFDFSKGDKDHERKLNMLNKCNMAMLKPVCEILDIERGGKKEELVERLMDFLLDPKDSGRKVPVKKTKKKSTGKKSKPTVKKEKKKETKKKAKTSSDSSEEEEVSDDEEKESEEEEEKESEEEEEKESEEEPSEEESEEEVPQKKKKPKKKPVKKENASKKKENGKKTSKKEKMPKVKSSPKKRKASVESSDDEDEPLAKKKKSEPPSNEELKEVIKKILEGANLEEITMKTVVKQVYGKFPQFDLADRKDFIKNTVKVIIS